MHALWGMTGTMFAKLLVVVDADVDLQDGDRVWFQAGAHVHPGRDVVLSEGPASLADHAAPVRGVGGKLGLDATRKLPAEGQSVPLPEELTLSPELLAQFQGRWAEYNLGPAGGESR